MKKLIFISLLIVSLVSSCGNGSVHSQGEAGDTLKLKYAEHISIVKYDGYSVVKLADPWNEGKTLHTYVLVPSDEELPSNLPKGTVVRTPLTKAVITTSVHCGLVMQFGKSSNIAGVCDLRYINLPWIQKQCSEGKIENCGSGLAPTLEKIIDCGADAILISPFQNNGGYGRLEEWGKPIIETADYMETSALGRAEWMKFYGMLFDAEAEATAMFNTVEQDYIQLKKLAQTSKIRLSVLMDKKISSVWYVPGGKSTIGGLIKDANAVYPFSANNASGSVPLPFETVLEKSGNADVWLFRYNSGQAATLQSLGQEYSGYQQFKAYKTKEVYGCNTAINTFYEDTPFRPDLLLRDFIIITHPDIKGLGATKYFVKLNLK